MGLIDPVLWDLLDDVLLEGALNTLLFSAIVIPAGAVVGFVLGWARVARHPIVSWPARVYVDLIRGIPAIVMILFAFFWLPLVFRQRGAGEAFALIALIIHTSAYQAEIFRAGFQSVPRGQIEAAEAVGLSRGQVIRYCVLPQAFRVTLPALGNEFAVVIKDTSLLAAIGMAELVFLGRHSAETALIAYGVVEWVLLTWFLIALLYFIITYIVTQTVGAIEHAYRVPGLGSVAF